jgi:hypothetical protein
MKQMKVARFATNDNLVYAIVDIQIKITKLFIDEQPCQNSSSVAMPDYQSILLRIE